MEVRWNSLAVNCCFLKFSSGGSSTSSNSSEPWATQGVSGFVVMVFILVYRILELEGNAWFESGGQVVSPKEEAVFQ